MAPDEPKQAGGPTPQPASSSDPDAADLEAHPGRPRGPDELDPELLNLRKPRGNVGWLLSVSIIVLCGYVIFQLRADLAFSRQPDGPSPLASIDEVLSAESDEFVVARLVPDRAYALRVVTRASNLGQRVYPVHGSDNRLWLVMSGSAWAESPTRTETYAGRVREMDAMPFASAVRAHVQALPPQPRYVSGEQLRSALGSGNSQFVHSAGDPIRVEPGTPVRVSQRVAHRARVLVAATEDHPDEETWRSALAHAGVLPPNTPAQSGTSRSWTFPVPARDGVEAVNATLVGAGLLAARAEPVFEVHDATWGQLEAQDDLLSIGGLRVPWSDIAEASVSQPRGIPAGARVLVASETPDTYWYVLPLCVSLMVFALMFVWALARTVRGEPSGGRATRAAA